LSLVSNILILGKITARMDAILQFYHKRFTDPGW
jgi:hypothetical protein